MRHAFLLEVAPHPTLQDRWRVLLVLSEFGVRRQRVHAITATVAPPESRIAGSGGWGAVVPPGDPTLAAAAIDLLLGARSQERCPWTTSRSTSVTTRSP